MKKIGLALVGVVAFAVACNRKHPAPAPPPKAPAVIDPASLSQFKQAASAMQAGLERRFGNGACNGVVECYHQAHFVGPSKVRVTGEIDAKGAVTSVKVDGAPKDGIAACLQAAMKQHHVEHFDLPRGTLWCQVSGTFGAGWGGLKIDGGFKH